MAWVAVLPAALAIDATRPAVVRFVVTDEQGQALSGARITLLGPLPGWPEAPQVEDTDDAGRADVERRRPESESEAAWTENVTVELNGYLSTGYSMRLFPGAKKDVAFKLKAERTTLIRLRGPGGEPLPRVGFKVHYAEGGYAHSDHGSPHLFFTDEQGECRWLHGPLPEGFRLSGRPAEEKLPDEPIVTVTYKGAETPFAARLLQGRLLRTDGSVASGWLVARKARFIHSGGLIHGPMINTMQVEDLTPVGPDGYFEVDAETWIVLISPEGIPVPYTLNPRAWPPGIRHVTLRVPGLRHVHQGVVIDDGGRPVADLPIEVPRVSWNGQLWEMSLGTNARRRARRLPGAKSTDGKVIAGISTSNHGTYTVPTYFGIVARLRAFRNGWSLMDRNGLATNGQNVWRRRKTVALDQLTDLTLVFEDEQGRPIPSVGVGQYKVYSAGEHTSSGGGDFEDSRGRHLFVDRSADRVELETRDFERKWRPLKTTVAVSGTATQVIPMKFDLSQRLLPLAGQIADPLGKPVPRARVILYAAAQKREVYGNDYLGFYTVTDEQGSFFFDAAPDDCYIEVRRPSDRLELGLPRWTTPLAVNRQTREVAIRLRSVPPTPGRPTHLPTCILQRIPDYRQWAVHTPELACVKMGGGTSEISVCFGAERIPTALLAPSQSKRAWKLRRQMQPRSPRDPKEETTPWTRN